MNYLHPSPHSSRIRTLPASALGVESVLPQLLAGLPPGASAAAPPDTAPSTHFPGVPSPLPLTQPFPSPCALPLVSPPAPSPPSRHATAEPRRVAARAGPLSHPPFYFSGGGRWQSRAKSLSENCSPPKPYIGANSDRAEDLPMGLKTSRARP